MARITLAVFLSVLILAGAAMSAGKAQPKAVTLDGQMLCMSCDLVTPNAPSDKSKTEGDTCACTAIFKSKDSKIYTLAPDKLGKELGDISMHEQYVQIKARQMPASQILAVDSYTVTRKVVPLTPENPVGWYNF